ncbi:MAG: hypothetical protein KAT57_04115, partial [Candidatus Lokiarchaeota archaeon]|nr:hypothetical protein [Candidatus Lokiarchaeota archaeon]
MDDNNKDTSEEYDEILDIETDKEFDTKIDEIQRRQIDTKRIKKIDQSKKRAAIESVFDERTIFT